ncbi:MAG: HPr(Ser) kinase/phosphatase [Sandaracinaceae bacterium]|nr:HPr(Ser) kinase/phosphatase [Sandaracinaceae bacterium]
MTTSTPSLPPGPPASTRALLALPALAGAFRVVAGRQGLDRTLTHPRIQKSGLVLAGHLHGIVPSRIQIFGETELTYFETLSPEARRERARLLFSLSPSLVVLTRDVEAPAELLEAAEASGSPLAIAVARSSQAITLLHHALDGLLAPREWRHGVMVEVYGVGILLVGPSGIGKSECALFLVERGHRLVADDRVEITSAPDGTLIGRPAPLLRHHLEIRGLGILNIRDLFGATAVRDEAPLHLVIELKSFERHDDADRLGIDDVTTLLLGQAIPLVTIPVRPGRDMGVLLEVAARNQLLKRSGHHGARAFVERLEKATLK